MQLQQRDFFEIHTAQTGMQLRFDLTGDVTRVGRVDHELRRYIGARIKVFEHTAQIAFGATVTVLRRRVEPVDTGCERPLHRGAHGFHFSIDHNAADLAAAEREFGYVDAGTPQFSMVHAGIP